MEEFGSFSMDLFTTRSDLDMSVNFIKGLQITREKKIQTLRKFAKKFYVLQSNVQHPYICFMCKFSLQWMDMCAYALVYLKKMILVPQVLLLVKDTFC